MRMAQDYVLQRERFRGDRQVAARSGGHRGSGQRALRDNDWRLPAISYGTLVLDV
jgi:hypothetical protein